MPSVKCCSVCFLNVSILHPRYSFLCCFSRPCKHGLLQPQQGVMWRTLIFSCCAHKFDLRHNPCIVIFACFAHKFDFHHNPCSLIFSSCAHKYDLHNNSCTLVFAFRVYNWFGALTFCRCTNTLRNTLLIV